jgi:hypothetical protein
MNNNLKQNILRPFSWTLLVGIICLTGGCRTTDQADSGDMASVTISGRSDAEIQQAVAKVFAANEYHQVNRLTFEKQGTGWDKVNYGGWSPNPVWIRMKINITSTEPGQSILACDAYAVVDRNQASMEEEKKLSVAYRSECKNILDQTKARLGSPPAGDAL